MSFTRVNPPGWAVGDILTSAQQNNLDIDHANALDKTVNGDVLSGVVTIAATGAIVVQFANGLVSEATGGITSTVAAGISSLVSGGIAATTAGGIKPGVSAGITSDIINGIAVTSIAGVNSQADGGLQSGNSANDWHLYAPTRTRTICHSLLGGSNGANWTINSGQPVLTAPATPASADACVIPLMRTMDGKFNGATLTGASLVFSVTQSHSGVPANLPNFSLFRMKVNNTFFASPPVSESLFSVSPQFLPNPGSGAAYYLSGVVQYITTTPNQNNVIDMSQYIYFAIIQDEFGTNSLGSNVYYALDLTFSNIGNSGPA